MSGWAGDIPANYILGWRHRFTTNLLDVFWQDGVAANENSISFK